MDSASSAIGDSFRKPNDLTRDQNDSCLQGKEAACEDGIDPKQECIINQSKDDDDGTEKVKTKISFPDLHTILLALVNLVSNLSYLV